MMAGVFLALDQVVPTGKKIGGEWCDTSLFFFSLQGASEGGGRSGKLGNFCLLNHRGGVFLSLLDLGAFSSGFVEGWRFFFFRCFASFFFFFLFKIE